MVGALEVCPRLGGATDATVAGGIAVTWRIGAAGAAWQRGSCRKGATDGLERLDVREVEGNDVVWVDETSPTTV
jgi:hypothetical protein